MFFNSASSLMSEQDGTLFANKERSILDPTIALGSLSMINRWASMI
jgi:hypothetical protein